MDYQSSSFAARKIDLANTEQALADVIYNKEKLAQILRLFPTFMVDKLVKIEGYKEEKYLKIIDKLDTVEFHWNSLLNLQKTFTVVSNLNPPQGFAKWNIWISHQ